MLVFITSHNQPVQQRKEERFVFTLENITHVFCDLKHLKEVIVICSFFVRENSRTYSNCLMDTLSTHHKHYVYLNIFGHHSLARTLWYPADRHTSTLFQWFIGSPEAHHSCHYNSVYSDTASNDISKDKTNIRVSADSLMCLLVVCIYIRWFTMAGLALSLILISVSCLVEIVYVELS